ncbi:MAG: hypothetical protein HN778_06360 [Prolixibacteraceae bacterium]|jgi:hypothetical protein|nr:hypothetical protein [Prolixibacteraceae bacterium]MBT6765428.1 hypothetical protein [Prolixibacteraceae bacterium]MBT6997847.1 hypothetical protein [Prolixibacteraceae bacterium]MBT7394438.1 hypothetical protein [Prolixibacteraceae bacterium]
MKKYLLTIVVASIFSSSFSQTIYEVRRAMDFFESNKMQSGDWKNPLSESEIEGTPYLNDEFIAGSIYTVMKHQYVDIPLRYNIYNDNIEFKSGDKIQALAAPEIVERIKFGEYQMVYIPYSNLKKIRKGFFIVLEEGKASLYTKLETEFKKSTEPGAYKEAEPPKFVRKNDQHYIRIGMEQAKKVGNKKELIEGFPDNKDNIEAFIKKNKVKTSKLESIKKLVQYYNSL